MLVFQVIDAALDVQVPFAHQVAQGLRELQEEVHGMEDIHLHSISDELGLLGPCGPRCRTVMRHGGTERLQESNSPA